MNVKTFDFFGPWSQMSGHHSQLFAPNYPEVPPDIPTCRGTIKYMRDRYVHLNKIMMGIPVYGRSFLGAVRDMQPFNGAGGENGIFQYHDLPGSGVQEESDVYTGGAYCRREDGGFVTYDNPTSIQRKAEFVKQVGLAGFFFWEGTGDTDGPRSLVMAGYCGLYPISPGVMEPSR